MSNTSKALNLKKPTTNIRKDIRRDISTRPVKVVSGSKSSVVSVPFGTVVEPGHSYLHPIRQKPAGLFRPDDSGNRPKGAFGQGSSKRNQRLASDLAAVQTAK